MADPQRYQRYRPYSNPATRKQLPALNVNTNATATPAVKPNAVNVGGPSRRVVGVPYENMSTAIERKSPPQKKWFQNRNLRYGSKNGPTKYRYTEEDVVQELAILLQLRSPLKLPTSDLGQYLQFMNPIAAYRRTAEAAWEFWQSSMRGNTFSTSAQPQFVARNNGTGRSVDAFSADAEVEMAVAALRQEQAKMQQKLTPASLPTRDSRRPAKPVSQAPHARNHTEMINLIDSCDTDDVEDEDEDEDDTTAAVDDDQDQYQYTDGEDGYEAFSDDEVENCHENGGADEQDIIITHHDLPPSVASNSNRRKQQRPVATVSIAAPNPSAVIPPENPITAKTVAASSITIVNRLQPEVLFGGEWIKLRDGARKPNAQKTAAEVEYEHCLETLRSFERAVAEYESSNSPLQREATAWAVRILLHTYAPALTTEQAHLLEEYWIDHSRTVTENAQQQWNFQSWLRVEEQRAQADPDLSRAISRTLATLYMHWRQFSRNNRRLLSYLAQNILRQRALDIRRLGNSLLHCPGCVQVEPVRNGMHDAELYDCQFHSSPAELMRNYFEPALAATYAQYPALKRPENERMDVKYSLIIDWLRFANYVPELLGGLGMKPLN